MILAKLPARNLMLKIARISWQWLKKDGHWLYLGFASWSWWLCQSTFSQNGQQLLIASKAWSDFAAHLPLIRSFSVGANFWPEYPQFAGQPIRYHYLFYLLVAGLERLGLNLALALNLISAIGLTWLLIEIFKLGRLIGHRCRVGVLAVILFLFNPSLTFVDYFREAGGLMAGLKKLPSLEHFVNFGPWNGDLISAFWNWNIYTNQRHLGLSLAVVLTLLFPLLAAIYQPASAIPAREWRWPKVVTWWLAMILLPFLHQAGWVILAILVTGWLLCFPRLIKDYGQVYFLGLLYALPGFMYYSGVNQIGWHPGFLAASPDWLDVINYWGHNFGHYLWLVPLLMVIASIKDKAWLWLTGGLLVIANLWQLSPDMINNHKLISFWSLAVTPVIAKYWFKAWDQASQWSKQKRIIARLALIGLLTTMTLSGVIDAWPIINDRQMVVADYQTSELGRYIATQSPRNSTWVTSYYLYHPVSLAGRKTFLDYGYFAWSLGYDDRSRRQTLAAILAPDQNLVNWCQLVKTAGIDYLVLSPTVNQLDINLKQSWLWRNVPPTQIFASEDEYLFVVANICPPALMKR